MAQLIDLSALAQAVQDETTVDGSAAVLIGQIAAQLKSLLAQPASLSTIQQSILGYAAQLEANKAALSAAVLANTPAAATTEEATEEETAEPTTAS